MVRLKKSKEPKKQKKLKKTFDFLDKISYNKLVNKN